MSQNGYQANDRSAVTRRTIPGSEVALTVRADEAGELLIWFAAQFDQRVEDIDTARGGTPDDWGYAERPIRGSTTILSNHASGTAIDLNALRHPLGAVGTFTREQVAEIRRILGEARGTIRWGGDFSGRKDEMHFEVDADAATVRAVVQHLRAQEVDDDMQITELYGWRDNTRRNLVDHQNWMYAEWTAMRAAQVAQTRMLAELLVAHQGGKEVDAGALLKRLEVSIEEATKRAAEAAERGARDGASAQILAALAKLEDRLNADDEAQAVAGARAVLIELRQSLPAN